MKKSVFAILAVTLSCCWSQLQAQSLKDLFGNGGVEDVVESVVDQLDVIPKNIEGNWEFAGSAVKFSGGQHADERGFGTCSRQG